MAILSPRAAAEAAVHVYDVKNHDQKISEILLWTSRINGKLEERLRLLINLQLQLANDEWQVQLDNIAGDDRFVSGPAVRQVGHDLLILLSSDKGAVACC